MPTKTKTRKQTPAERLAADRIADEAFLRGVTEERRRLGLNDAGGFDGITYTVTTDTEGARVILYRDPKVANVRDLNVALLTVAAQVERISRAPSVSVVTVYVSLGGPTVAIVPYNVFRPEVKAENYKFLTERNNAADVLEQAARMFGIEERDQCAPPNPRPRRPPPCGSPTPSATHATAPRPRPPKWRG